MAARRTVIPSPELFSAMLKGKAKLPSGLTITTPEVWRTNVSIFLVDMNTLKLTGHTHTSAGRPLVQNIERRHAHKPIRMMDLAKFQREQIKSADKKEQIDFKSPKHIIMNDRNSFLVSCTSTSRLLQQDPREMDEETPMSSAMRFLTNDTVPVVRQPLAEVTQSLRRMTKMCADVRLTEMDGKFMRRLEGRPKFGYLVIFRVGTYAAAGMLVEQNYSAPAMLNNNIEDAKVWWRKVAKMHDTLWKISDIVRIRVKDMAAELAANEHFWAHLHVTKGGDDSSRYGPDPNDLFALPPNLYAEFSFDKFDWRDMKVLGHGANGIAVSTAWFPDLVSVKDGFLDVWDTFFQPHEKRLWEHRYEQATYLQKGVYYVHRDATKPPPDDRVYVHVVLKLTSVGQPMYLARLEYAETTKFHRMDGTTMGGVYFGSGFIMPVFGYVLYGNWYGMVTKIMTGGDLYKRMISNRALQTAMRRMPNDENLRRQIVLPLKAMKMMMEIVYSLVFLHHHRIIHGDLKIYNVFIDEKDQCILGDFGAMAFFDKPHPNMGTAMFTPPDERETKDIVVRRDGRRDIYAFGKDILPFFLLTVNFNAANVAQLRKIGRNCLSSKEYPTAFQLYRLLSEVYVSVAQLPATAGGQVLRPV